MIAAAATGTSAETFDRVAALVEAGLDILVVDTAHGHSAKVLHTIEVQVCVKASVPHSCSQQPRADGDCVAASSRVTPCAQKCSATEETRKAS